MALADATAVGDQVALLIGTVWGNLEPTEQAQLIQQALDELSFALPETHQKRCYWILERTKRHCLYYMVVSSAERFRYKQIHLHQKFDNYFRLISLADDAFAKAMENDIEGVFPIDLIDAELFAKNGFWVNPAGFVYDQVGRDLTYDGY